MVFLRAVLTLLDAKPEEGIRVAVMPPTKEGPLFWIDEHGRCGWNQPGRFTFMVNDNGSLQGVAVRYPGHCRACGGSHDG